MRNNRSASLAREPHDGIRDTNGWLCVPESPTGIHQVHICEDGYLSTGAPRELDVPLLNLR